MIYYTKKICSACKASATSIANNTIIELEKGGRYEHA